MDNTEAIKLAAKLEWCKEQIEKVPHLTVRLINKTPYFFYCRPLDKKQVSFGTNMETAIKTARNANEIWEAELAKIKYQSRIKKATQSIKRPEVATNDFIESYISDVLTRKHNNKKLSDRSFEEYTRVCRAIARHFGDQLLSEITQHDLSQYLLSLKTDEVFNKHRQHLTALYKEAISQGYITDNLAEKVNKREQGIKKRSALNWNEYCATYEKAPRYIQDAMDLSLALMQRREDISNLKFDYLKDGYLFIFQNKTQTKVRIPVNMPLVKTYRGAKTCADLITSCRTRLLSPYVVHNRNKYKTLGKDKDHWTQVRAQMISKGFHEALMESGIFNKKPRETWPTYHEILGLGEKLLIDAGWTLEQIQSMRGHKTPRMTRHYLENHDWNEVKPPAQYGLPPDYDFDNMRRRG